MRIKKEEQFELLQITRAIISLNRSRDKEQWRVNNEIKLKAKFQVKGRSIMGGIHKSKYESTEDFTWEKEAK